MDGQKSFSIMGNSKTTSAAEKTAQGIFTLCAFIAILAVVFITVYMIMNGTPALFSVGIKEIVFGTVWKPASAEPSFGILYVILTSIIGTALAVLLGVSIGLLTAVFLAETAPKKLTVIVKPAVEPGRLVQAIEFTTETLSGIPSIIFGLFGMVFFGNAFGLGYSILTGSLTLTLMVLPLITRNTQEALKDQSEEEIIKIRNNDKIINRQQREIESMCLFLITKQQPIVGDLRVVTASLKVVTDIERIGDHVADMADLLLRLKMKDLSLFFVHIEGMIGATREMFCNAVDAFVDRDLESAGEVIREDDVIDDLFNKVKNDLIESLKKEIKDADECIDVLMIAKYPEKIGDHAVNIGEWEIFQETGNISDVRLL